MQVSFRRVDWEYASSMRLSYRTKTHARAVIVELREGDRVGRGEGLGVAYHGETPESLLEQLSAIEGDLRNGLSRADLQSRLPAGGARNAVDCALWDLEARQRGCRAWELAGMHAVHPLLTTYTLGIDSPDTMSRAAAAVPRYSLLKIKLNGDADDLWRALAVRRARPDAGLVVDANQSLSPPQLRQLLPHFLELGVTLIEQPLPASADAELAGFDSPIPLCADESCQTVASVAALAGKYQYANIKLDKCGGLTEALQLAAVAKASGLKLMVGCMGGSSLSMAPAFIIGQMCDVVDLDGPLLLKADVANAIRYDGNRMSAPESRLWG
jgi:L-Ala-D/L-Glu epimerase